MKYYMNIFLIYSIIGYILETTLKIFNPGMNNGTLYGPWIPIYGFGSCIIIAIMRLVFNRFKLKKTEKIVCIFLISMISLTVLELVSGYLIEIFTGKVFWDYSKMRLNFGHYISLEISLVWGFASLILIYLINPFLNKLIKKIPSLITCLVFIIFIIDLAISIIT